LRASRSSATASSAAPACCATLPLRISEELLADRTLRALGVSPWARSGPEMRNGTSAQRYALRGQRCVRSRWQPLRIVSGDIAASFDSQRPRFGMLWSAAFSAFCFWCILHGGVRCPGLEHVLTALIRVHRRPRTTGTRARLGLPMLSGHQFTAGARDDVETVSITET
jgi:hypothetical protein